MHLKIKNFASLSNIDIKINDVTILIGEQASGKSLTCKVYFFLREIVSKKIKESISKETGFAKLQWHLKIEFLALFPDYSWKKNEFEIAAYSIFENDSTEADITITYSPGGNGIRFCFSKYLKKQYKLLATDFKNLKKETDAVKKTGEDNKFFIDFTILRIFKKTLVKSKAAILFEDVTYIPSGRSFFSTIKDNVFGFLSENIGIDPFLKSFGGHYEYSKYSYTRFSEKNKISTKEFDALSYSIVKGKFESSKNEEWIVSGDRKISLSHASSGQQEVLPLILVLRRELTADKEEGNKCIIVEEPEAHLFPTSQQAIVNLIFLIKKEVSNTNFIITTHSPYILACINNEILKSNESVKVFSYYISNGKSKLITDVDSGLVNGEDLDKVSSDISDEFFLELEKNK